MYGLAAGHANIIMSKSINETVPGELSGQFGIMTNGFISTGIMLSFFLGAVLPEDEADFAGDEGWRIIFAMPSVIALTQMLLFLFIFKEEPIDFCIGNERLDEAKVLMKKVYLKPKGMEEDVFDKLIEESFELQRQCTTTDSSTISTGQAVCGPKYRKATWLLFALNTFSQQSGITAVLMFCNRLLVRIGD